MSLLTLNHVILNVANNRLLDDVDWKIQPNDKIALVGRNGMGKSTVLKLLMGELVPDRGEVVKTSGVTIAALAQEVPLNIDDSIYHFLVKDLPIVGDVIADFHRLSQGDDMEALGLCQQKMDNLQAWDVLPRVEMMANKLSIPTTGKMDELSGGMKRRVLLAAALIAQPDILLLDEPTNHLDLTAIEWLESYLKTYPGSLIVVTHDREFLDNVATQIVEIDRGKLFTYACNYATFLDRRDARLETEDKHNALFDKQLSDEEAWIRTGIKARRTRNEGRVRALKALREEYKARKHQMGKVKSVNMDVTRSGALVCEAEGMSYSIDDKNLLKNFSLIVNRGDKLGIIGPNGCGKTTLLRLLLGELQPTAGKVRLGTTLDIAYFDQLRRQLKEDETVMFNVGDGADYVTVNGKQKHVASYLREFLFPPERFNQKVTQLSGGERNRLLLAKLLAKPVNLLVMDEPTNDLDIETLELLESLLVEYKGTLLLISHDRAFINEVVTSILVWEGEGTFNEYVGGYEDYRIQQKQQREVPNAKPKTTKREASNKLSFNEQRELSQLPQKIESLETDIAALHALMADPDFYQQTAEKLTQHNKLLADKEQQLAVLYERWESLEG